MDWLITILFPLLFLVAPLTVVALIYNQLKKEFSEIRPFSLRKIFSLKKGEFKLKHIIYFLIMILSGLCFVGFLSALSFALIKAYG